MANLNVIFNLSDTSGGEVLEARDRLLKRSGTRHNYFKGVEVRCYNLWELLNDGQKQTLTRTGSNGFASIARIRRDCSRASKIIVALHGPREHTDFGIVNVRGGLTAADFPADVQAGNAEVANTGGERVQVSVDKLAELLEKFLEKGRKHYISLLICYAARSSRAAQDHSVTGGVDWSDSFACNLFRQLCAGRQVNMKMVARTGQAGYSGTTGQTEVQTEVAIVAEREVSELNHAGELHSDFSEGVSLESFQNAKTKELIEEMFDRVIAVAKKNPKIGSQTVSQARILGKVLDEQGMDIPAADRAKLRNVVRHTLLMNKAGEKQIHHGKILYNYDWKKNRIKISYVRKGWPNKRLQTVRI